MAGRFVSIAAIFPLRNGYIAHSIEAVLGIDHVPALHDQVVLCFRGPELRALRRLQREDASTAYVFMSERKAPLTPHTVRKIVARAGRQAGIEFPVHPHMLRHATGYQLANERTGHQGDPAILRASKYSAHHTLYLAPSRFKDFWRD